MTRYANRIRSLRETVGLSQAEVHARLGATDSSFIDLELYDNELFTVPSLNELVQLCAILSVSPVELCRPDDAIRPSTSPITYRELVGIVKRHLATSATTMADFEDAVGWDLGNFMAGEKEFLETYNVTFLIDLATQLNLDWLALLPPGRVAA